MNRDERESRLREELDLHVELETEANIARGMSPADARRAARIALGAAEHFKEEARDQFRSPLRAALGQDLRYAARVARRTPLLTGVAVLTLGVAFALATSAFTAVNAVILRALPYPEPERLALIWGTSWGTSRARAERNPVSFTNASDWRRDIESLESLAMFSCAPRPILTAQGQPARATMMVVSADFFHVLGARAMIGRLLDTTDVGDDQTPAVVLTYPLWRDRFGEDRAAIGSRVRLDGAPVTVVGVLPPDFAPVAPALGCRPDIYRALDARYDDAQRSWAFLKVIARLRPGASLRQAQAELDVENARLADAHPATNRGKGAIVVGMREFLTRPVRPTVLFAQAGALLVLLVACANIAGLLLVRGTVRRREMSVRIALGASGARLARQVATECLLLGIVSAAVGTLLALIGSGILAQFAGDALSDPRALALDWHVMAFTAVVSIAATSAFALVAVFGTRGDATWLLSSLRDGGRGATSRRQRAGKVIVTAQLAISVMVLVGAVLLARSYRRLRDVHPGFDPADVLTARVSLPEASYPRGPRQIVFFRQLLDRIARQPGVIAAGAVSILPESPNYDHTNARVVGRQYAPGDEPIPDVYRVTPGYFTAMRIPLASGRGLTADDDDRHSLVAIVNETMARALFPGENVVGRRIWTGAGNSERTIVGVVGDVYQYGLESTKTMQLYVPHADNAGGDLTLVVRTTTPNAGAASLVRAAIRALDPGVPLDDVMTMEQVLAASASRRRLLANLSLTFALGAVALAAIGLYGVIAYSVARREHEIGVRMALGATPRGIVGQVIGDASATVLAGIAIGLLGAASLAKLMTPLVFGVTVTDAVAFVVAPAVLVAVATLASALPALRAASVNPIVALRGE